MKLTLSLAQIKVIKGDPAQNIANAIPFIEKASKLGSELIIFPEMWTTGFDWKNLHELTEDSAKSIKQLGSLAKQYKIWISGSLLSLDEEKNKPSNTSILFDSSGNIVTTYQKTHLFSPIEEDRYLSPGNKLTTFNAPWGVTGLSICYDLRFPELFRTYALQGARIVVLSAAFAHPKLDLWKTLLCARAIENQMYIVAVNQVGQEEFSKVGNLNYFGSSMIIDPLGKIIVEGNWTEEELITETIDMAKVDEVRSKMDVLKELRSDLYFKNL